MTKRLTALAAAAALLTGLGILAPTLADWPAMAVAQSNDTSAAEATAETADADAPLVQEMTLGDPEAPIEVIEYASFTCPHCKNFHAGPFKELKKDWIDSGKVHFIYREVYFDRYGLWAGMVARCAGPDRYFAVADLLYEKQGDWARGEPAQIAANLRRLGKTAGLSDEQLDQCLSDADKAQAMVQRFEETSEEHDITSTPSFVINGEKHANMSYEDFSALLQDELDK